jgi:hypothetical protein
MEDIKKKAIKDYVFEMSASMARAEGERDLQKEATKRLAEDHELDKAMLKKLAKIYHKSNFSTVKADTDELETMYETLFGDK